MKLTKNIVVLIALACIIYLSTSKVFSESTKTKKDKDVIYNVSTKKTIVKQELKEKEVQDSKDTVLIETENGPIKIKLFVDKAPITSNNFIDLVSKGFYNGTIFHRVINDFVIQGGDPLGDGTGNYIDPKTGKARFIKLETDPSLKFDKKGRVGMARTSDPDSASCQFFIALQPLPSLDPAGVDPNGYAVFGQVSDDTLETLDKIVKNSKPVYPGSDRPAKPIKMLKLTLQ